MDKLLLPHNTETFQALAKSGVKFSTATATGVVQSFLHRAGRRLTRRLEGYHLDGEEATLIIEAFSLAALSEDILKIIQDAKDENDQDRKRELMELAISYLVTSTRRGDDLGINIWRFCVERKKAHCNPTSY